MPEVKMVVVNGIRYRPEDAPEQPDEVEHKMREPRKATRKPNRKS